MLALPISPSYRKRVLNRIESFLIFLNGFSSHTRLISYSGYLDYWYVDVVEGPELLTFIKVRPFSGCLAKASCQCTEREG